MKITKRKREFLETVAALCQQKGTPVHYAEVAYALKISKWTAYDVLKELEKKGFVKSAYAVKESGSELPGRSRVMFWAPDIEADELGAGVIEAIEEHLGDEAREQVKKRADRWLKITGCRGTCFALCAKFVIALLLLLEAFASPNIGGVKAAVASVPTADVGLLVFAGGAAASLLGCAKSIPAVKRVLDGSLLYTRSLSLLTEEARDSLFEMLKGELGLDKTEE